MMPAHHVDLLTGIGPFGARIEERRTKPDSGREVLLDKGRLRSIGNGDDLAGPVGD